ncbi:MAG: SHOCT domain-containing protein [Acidibrevibacterium sp.]|uniref:SHOCT domain-containing protein n=1 Tax=Acidibrevibacterium fodinaquatile TaxID=1969806 RepID=UPI0023A868F3|nr:SHOCT domain-containing protein [Acidibrevibacterium fodinaquatile]MCA7118359.1 SHOCT domain-containing protein [Acidibrevibacterium fodinaquatile]
MKASLSFVAMMGAAAALAPAWAWSQTLGEPYRYGMPMMWGWSGMIFGPLFMILMLAAVIVVAVLAIRWLASPWQGAGALPHLPPNRTALDILNERFARGEIDQAEYEAKRRLISQG